MFLRRNARVRVCLQREWKINIVCNYAWSTASTLIHIPIFGALFDPTIHIDKVKWNWQCEFRMKCNSPVTAVLWLFLFLCIYFRIYGCLFPMVCTRITHWSNAQNYGNRTRRRRNQTRITTPKMIRSNVLIGYVKISLHICLFIHSHFLFIFNFLTIFWLSINISDFFEEENKHTKRKREGERFT